MNWSDRLRLAWRALRGGAPESIVRREPAMWTRPPETLTGWDALLSDATILHNQLRRAEMHAEDYEQSLRRYADRIEQRSEDLTVLADFEIEDEDAADAVDRQAKMLQDHADMIRREVDR